MQVYLVCAIVGGALVGLRFLLVLFAWGGSDKYTADISHRAHQVANLLEQITLPLAGLAAFGVGGVVATLRRCSEIVAFGFASAAAGLVVLPIVLLGWLSAKRDIAVARTLNCNGVVSETIPAQQAGAGRVVVALPSRVVEVRAVTTGNELPEGAKVHVRAVVDATTVEVTPLADFDEIWRQARPK